MLKTGRVNHIAVKVSDVEKSREFYEKIVGLKTLLRPKTNIPGEWYGLGDGALHLTGGGKRGIGIDPTDPHVAIEVDNIDDTKRTLGVFYLDAPVLMARMNLSPEQIKVAGMQVWVADPEGNVLELQRRID
jgi:catechol 2,3-dioxygenase-like lactoylglutathione lyase family enzyme